MQLAREKPDCILGAGLQAAEQHPAFFPCSGIGIAVCIDAVPAEIRIGGAQVIGNSDGVSGAVRDLQPVHFDHVPVGIEIGQHSAEQRQNEQPDQYRDPLLFSSFRGLRFIGRRFIRFKIRRLNLRLAVFFRQDVVDGGKQFLNGLGSRLFIAVKLRLSGKIDSLHQRLLRQFLRGFDRRNGLECIFRRILA